VGPQRLWRWELPRANFALQFRVYMRIMLHRKPLVSISFRGAVVACPAYLGIFQLGCKADATRPARGVVARRKIVCVQIALVQKHAATAYFRMGIRDVLVTPRMSGCSKQIGRGRRSKLTSASAGVSAAPAPQTGQLGCAVEERQCWSMADCDLYFRLQGWHMTTCFASTCCGELVERGLYARGDTHLF
jgi:hypothetical protein